ncbi:MAG TPA: BCAM0308 family protein [Burkholderiaceae bacterium]
MSESDPRSVRRRGPHHTGFDQPDAKDPCRARRKTAEPAACPDCGAVQEAGQWRWRRCSPGARPLRCPACCRIRDNLPAGELHLTGDFLAAHRDEVLARVRHVVEHTRKRYVLQRLMEIDEDDRQVRITTTSPHLARAIGLALHDAFKGTLDLDMQTRGCPRVRWTR